MIIIDTSINRAVFGAMSMKSMVSFEDEKRIPLLQKTNKLSLDGEARSVIKKHFEKYHVDYQTEFEFLKVMHQASIFGLAQTLDEKKHFQTNAQGLECINTTWPGLRGLPEAMDRLYSEYYFDEVIRELQPLIAHMSSLYSEMIHKSFKELLPLFEISELEVQLCCIPLTQNGGKASLVQNLICLGSEKTIYGNYNPTNELIIHEMCHIVINTFIDKIESNTPIIAQSSYEKLGIREIKLFQNEVLARVFTAWIMKKHGIDDYKMGILRHRIDGWKGIGKSLRKFEKYLQNNTCYEINHMIENISI
ncbi:MAG: DUF4932 domain-containing protein [Cellulosilyticaceae bacterium]